MRSLRLHSALLRPRDVLLVSVQSLGLGGLDKPPACGQDASTTMIP